MAQQGIPLSEAAERLGVSTDVVRKRVKRGTMPAYKGDDGRWYAVLDELDQRVGPNGNHHSDSGRTEPGSLSSPSASTNFEREVALLREFLTSKDQEIDFLRAEMSHQREQWAEESRRKDVIIHELSSQLKALPEKIVEQQQAAAAEPEPEPTPTRPWWKFWTVD
jgi:excisionase family DNA binding protein